MFKFNIKQMKKTGLLLVCTLLFTVQIFAQEKLTADTSKTKISWLGERIASKHTGTVKLKSGWLNLQENKITSGEFLIDMSTIKDDDNNQKLTSHLKSDDFFGVAKFPESKLVIKNSTPFDKGSGTVSGDLTLKGITSPVEFKTSMKKAEDGIWFYSNIIIDRTKYDVRFGSGSFFENLGDRTIFDEITFKVSLFVK
jgi:polyisoprenoid-binding protein YceI